MLDESGPRSKYCEWCVSKRLSIDGTLKNRFWRFALWFWNQTSSSRDPSLVACIAPSELCGNSIGFSVILNMTGNYFREIKSIKKHSLAFVASSALHIPL
jgi:hypothetical protein